MLLKSEWLVAASPSCSNCATDRKLKACASFSIVKAFYVSSRHYDCRCIYCRHEWKPKSLNYNTDGTLRSFKNEGKLEVLHQLAKVFTRVSWNWTTWKSMQVALVIATLFRSFWQANACISVCMFALSNLFWLKWVSQRSEYLPKDNAICSFQHVESRRKFWEQIDRFLISLYFAIQNQGRCWECFKC